MRGRVWSILLVVFLFTLPVGNGQGSSGTEEPIVLTDPAGDESVAVQDPATVPSGARWTNLDMTSLSMQEDRQGFTFTLALTELDPDGEDIIIVDQVGWWVNFTFEEEPYQVFFIRSPAEPVDDNVFYEAALRQYDPSTGFYAYLLQLPLTVDLDANTLTATVPREAIQNADGATPAPGDHLENIHAVSSLSLNNLYISAGVTQVAVPFSGHDYMPDEGAEHGVWEVKEGIEQKGHLLIASDRPVRLSNGEATTFLFEIDVTNMADHPDTALLDFQDAPPEWTVTFPEDELRLDAEETRVVAALVTVPFNHEHGTFESMLVQVRSQADPEALGQLPLGVRYTAVPQPAGHHSTLHIHLGASGAYMNTLAEDPGATGDPDGSNGEGGSGAVTTYRWNIPLSPALGMGLDFDVDGRGSLQVPVTMPAGGLDVTAQASLAVYQGGRSIFSGERIPLATMGATAPQDVTPGDTVEFMMEVVPTQESDWVPFVPSSSLMLNLEVTATTVFGLSLTPAAPELAPGGVMELPLNEFHDDVDDYFSALSGVELVPTSAQQRLVNPGETVLFQVDAENVGALEGTFDLELTGTNTQWGRILGDTRITLGPGQARPMAVAVSPPEGTADGTLADITLHATKSDDPNVRSLIRFLVEADTDEDHPDEAEAANGVDAELRSKETPWPGVLLVAGALAVGLRMRRE